MLVLTLMKIFCLFAFVTFLGFWLIEDVGPPIYIRRSISGRVLNRKQSANVKIERAKWIEERRIIKPIFFFLLPQRQSCRRRGSWPMSQVLKICRSHPNWIMDYQQGYCWGKLFTLIPVSSKLWRYYSAAFFGTWSHVRRNDQSMRQTKIFLYHHVLIIFTSHKSLLR